MNAAITKIESFLQRLSPYLLGIVLSYGLCVLPRQTPAVMIVCAVILLIIARKHIHLPRLSEQGLAIAALLYVIASAFWSDSPRALEMVRDLMLIGASGLVLSCVNYGWGEDFMSTMMRTFAIGFAVAAILFSVNAVLDFPYQHYMGMKISGNHQGYWETNIPKRSGVLFAIYLWPVMLYCWRAGWKRWGLMLMGFSVFTIMLSYSRAALLADFAAMAVLGLSFWRVRIGQAIGFLMLPLSFFVILGLGLVCLSTIRPVITNYLSPSGDYRLFIWDYAAHEQFKHQPFGIGIDGSRVLPDDDAAADHRPPSIYQDGDLLPIHPHNVFLQIWLELGIVGVGLMTAMLFFVWRWICAQATDVQPFLWAYAVAAVTTLGIAYGAWQGWWLGGQALAGLLVVRVVEMKFDRS